MSGAKPNVRTEGIFIENKQICVNHHLLVDAIPSDLPSIDAVATTLADTDITSAITCGLYLISRR